MSLLGTALPKAEKAESGMVKELPASGTEAKALFPMWVTESGMVKLAKDVQFWKEQASMWVTESRMVQLARDLPVSKAEP